MKSFLFFFQSSSSVFGSLCRDDTGIRFSFVRLLLSVVCILFYVLLPQYGFSSGSDVWSHVLYSFSHANVWHLLANLLCLWMLRCDLHVVYSLLSAVCCSYLPCFISEPTMGLSGVLFCAVGMSWGKVGRFRAMLWRNKWWLLIPLFLPHVNGFIHLYCLVCGYVLGRFMFKS